MAGRILRKTGVILLIILKCILQVVLFSLKLVFGAAKLFLLLFALIVKLVLAMVGISAKR